MRLPPDSLAHALSLAAVALGKLRQGTALPQAIEAVCQGQPAPARGAVQDLAYRATRWLGSTDWLIRTLIPRPPAEGAANLLRVALAQLLDVPQPYAPFTVVDQTVRAASADPKLAHGKGMVNGVLRRFLREQDGLVAAMQADPVAATNYPAWWIDAVRSAYPGTWQAILAAGNRRPPMVLRVNPRRIAVDAYLARLAESGIEAERIGEQAVRLARAVPVAELPGFADGDVSVQDAGAQLAAPLLDVAPGHRVLDACAAPGGKTGHLLELADGLDVTALESDASRAVRIDENLARLRQTATVRVGDAAQPDTWWDGRPFDRILADVPCSAAGIVRRHPDIRWLRRPADLKALAALQRDIVRALWACLAPGGKLLYVTCSIFPTEGEDQARWFESHLQDAIRLHAPGQLLPALPESAPAGGFAAGTSPLPLDHDGFFYAVFQKRP
ncbi:16S rRNA (cytosine(967)-C(5))-methyltransferase RsmB [Ralstonia mannitolilytica]|uniref:16S rRNA (cytosine(967)-C(5))-methyltransferase n=1 Tax=Ralstonia mannitolilytica TaxID=105219 RepID=A0AAD2AQY9_9RALS|nr:16S rRNA (cytosine(967)-C(5))-methyltransferase RsmB [Ralstonia mannitolilytica]ATG21220.1 16S rRNA (cytosine(967)-C(5))-methyltransferase [Ralstonia pickettii]MBY4718039.1 16S rRNA (cytosine(967)-C(5))-methyltransferase RsmB [Ralstonia mannitolilytica]CAJ0682944.1 Ribosomal RNA small subunit methyltransferase B [Ralstonia mannitolilytica]CAJ0741723.1 Ribosomal RNA small subunit methyltransferase B [Ralstonia mannitolilytica]CAJ0899010.1 Ribosomal RNA small subunit methyltransferase B [Rals